VFEDRFMGLGQCVRFSMKGRDTQNRFATETRLKTGMEDVLADDRYK